MNSRRQFLLVVIAGAIAARTPAFAQGTNRVFRIGWVSLAAPGTPSQFLEAFRQGLKERGYVEGRNVVIEVRLAAGSRELADQMVQGSSSRKSTSSSRREAQRGAPIATEGRRLS